MVRLLRTTLWDGDKRTNYYLGEIEQTVSGGELEL